MRKILTSILFLLFFYSISPFSIASDINNSQSKNNSTEDSNSYNLPFLGNKDDSYLLGPGDLLYIDVFDDKSLSRELRILNDGSSSLPLIGSVRLEGLSLNQAKQKIETLLGKELIRPEIQLNVLQTRSIWVSMIGEISSPGVYNLNNKLSTLSKNNSSKAANPRENYNYTLVDSIQHAGGITPTTDLKNILIVRRIKGINSYNHIKAKISLYDLIINGELSNNPYLHDGDKIIFSKIDSTNTKEQIIATNNLSPRTIQINIIGEVKNPGPISLKSNTPLIQAIYSAGGPNYLRANKSNIQLIRVNVDGSVTLKKYYLNLNQGVSNSLNPLLKDGDIVILKPNSFGKVASTLNNLIEPVGGLLNVVTLLKISGN